MSTPSDAPAFLTTQQVAAALGVTPRRVVALIQAGRLKASRLGRDWPIPAHADLADRVSQGLRSSPDDPTGLPFLGAWPCVRDL